MDADAWPTFHLIDTMALTAGFTIGAALAIAAVGTLRAFGIL